MSELEEKVIVKLRERAEKGLQKYGVTMERDDLVLTEWLIHLQEELMDATVYIQKLLEILKTSKAIIVSNSINEKREKLLMRVLDFTVEELEQRWPLL